MNRLSLFVHNIWGPFSLKRSAWRLSLLVAPWLIVVSIPALRTQLLEGPNFVGVPTWWNREMGDDYEPVTFKMSAQSHPHSLAAQFFARCEDNYQDPNGVAGDDALIARYPNAIWIRADRLMAVHQDAISDYRIARPIEMPSTGGRSPYYGTAVGSAGAQMPATDLISPYEAVAAPTPSPVNSSSHGTPDPPGGPPMAGGPLYPPLPGKDEVRKYFTDALVCARAGQVREPSNIVFDLYAARSLFALGRDGQALALLHRAAGKLGFDCHQREKIKARIEADEFVSRESPVNFSAFSYYDHIDWTLPRHTVQLATADAAALESVGKHAEALQIYGDLSQLCDTMRRGSYTASEALASCACASIVWAGTNRPVSLRDLKLRNPRIVAGDWSRIGAQKFAHYALAHGRPDLASRAVHDGEAFALLRENIARWKDEGSHWPVVLTRSSWLVSACVFLFSGVSLLFFALLACRFIFFLVLIPGGLKTPRPAATDLVMIVGWPLIVATILSFVSLNFASYERTANGDTAYYLSQEWSAFIATLAYGTPLFLTSIAAAVLVVRRQRRGTKGDRIKPRCADRLHTFLSGKQLDPPLRMSGIALAILCWSPMVVVVAGIVASALLISFIDPLAPATIVLPFTNTPIGFDSILSCSLVWAAICAPVSLIGWLIRWRWWPAPRYRESAHYALACYRESLSWWNTLIGWAIVGVLCLLLGPFATAKRERAAAIERGEVRTLFQTRTP